MVKDEEENAGNEAAEVGGGAERLLKTAHKEGASGINDSRSSCPCEDLLELEGSGASCIDRRGLQSSLG
ncbi:hypothetical protein SAY86_023372 [Trapa natans]|uniref:Uncharacterized protein n=1 Tax=Trapa natans TaxID=22666 RepID=A0AAN7M6Y7_TRANT|nr:hypothetical protein SAY86_023372 [Trapa natans]